MFIFIGGAGGSDSEVIQTVNKNQVIIKKTSSFKLFFFIPIFKKVTYILKDTQSGKIQKISKEETEKILGYEV